MDDADLLDSLAGFPRGGSRKIDGGISCAHDESQHVHLRRVPVKGQGRCGALCASLRENSRPPLDVRFPDHRDRHGGDYVVSVYGYTDLVDTFTAKLAAAYPAPNRDDDPIV